MAAYCRLALSERLSFASCQLCWRSIRDHPKAGPGRSPDLFLPVDDEQPAVPGRSRPHERGGGAAATLSSRQCWL